MIVVITLLHCLFILILGFKFAILLHVRFDQVWTGALKVLGFKLLVHFHQFRLRLRDCQSGGLENLRVIFHLLDLIHCPRDFLRLGWSLPDFLFLEVFLLQTALLSWLALGFLLLLHLWLGNHFRLDLFHSLCIDRLLLLDLE